MKICQNENAIYKAHEVSHLKKSYLPWGLIMNIFLILCVINEKRKTFEYFDEKKN